VEGLSRQDIRQHVGDNLPDFYLGVTTSAGGNATSVIDTRAWGGVDDQNGSWIRFYDGTLDGETRRVDDFDGAGDHTTQAFSGNVPTGASYERWAPQYHPEAVDRFINLAINAIIGVFYQDKESVALHADGLTARFDLPSEFQMVNKVERRASVDELVVHNGDRTFDETTDADFTQVVDTEVKKTGQSLKMTVADGASAGDFVTDSITSIDISRYTHLEGWIRSSVALTAADYKIHLNDSAVLADGNDQESLDIPAATADTWTYWRVSLAAPENDTAIISIGIEMDQDKGAHTVWFSNIKVVDHNSAHYVEIPNQTWSIDKQANDLILKPSGRKAAGYSLLKISGGSHPAQMTADSDIATVPESYLIAYATAMRLRAGSRATAEDTEGRRNLADRWFRTARIERAKFPMLVDVRRVA